MKVTVMTFNIHHGKGADGRLDLGRIAGVIEESEADIIGLNEVDNGFSGRSGFADQLSWLAERLKLHASYGPALTLSSRKNGSPRQFGNAVLSRFPIVETKNRAFFSPRIGMAEGRAYLQAEVAVSSHILNIYVTHLSLHPLRHGKQLDAICRIAAEERGPVIWMGDWNMRPGSRAWRKITAYLRDAASAVPSSVGCTFPSHRPRLRLDHIFVNRHLQIETAEVVKLCPEASDHLPLKAILHL